jgi:hypothetical protein
MMAALKAVRKGDDPADVSRAVSKVRAAWFVLDRIFMEDLKDPDSWIQAFALDTIEEALDVAEPVLRQLKGFD